MAQPNFIAPPSVPITPAPALPAGVADLLQAVHDALIVPIAKNEAGEAARLALFARRTGDVRVIVAHLLTSEYLDACEAAETLRTWTAENPVAYMPWKDTRTGESTPAAQDGGQR